MPFADIGPVRLHYEVDGSGPPLILIPGWTLNTRFWDPVCEVLKGTHRVIRYDVRGAGGSTADPGIEYSRMADSEDLAGLMDYLGLPAAHVVGHSKGARIALYFAMRWPHRALSVVAVGSAEPAPLPEQGPTFRPVAEAWVDRARRIARERGSGAAVEMLSGARLFGKVRTSPEGVRLLRQAMEGYGAADLVSTVPTRTFDSHQNAAKLIMPILFLAGEEDPFLPECRFAQARIPSSRLEILTRCGHMAPLERPRAISGAILHFLTGDSGLPSSAL